MGAAQILAIALAVAVAAAVAMAFLWLRARSGAGASRSQSGTGQFAANEVYRLHAIFPITDPDAGRHFGLVEDELAELTSFVTDDDLSSLSPGDCFTLVRGQFVRVDDGAFSGADRPLLVDAAGASPARAMATTPPGAPARMIPSEHELLGDDDATEIVSPSGVEAARSVAAAPITPQAAPVPDASFDEDRTRMVAPDAAAAAESAVNGLCYLLVTVGVDKDHRFPVPFGHSTIGRDKQMTISLGDDASSRLHCEIIYRDHAFWLRDAGSTNGTWCNDQKIDEHELTFGDKIKVAETEMTFTCDGHELKSTDPNGAIRALEMCVS